jgi:hypothetical protein
MKRNIIVKNGLILVYHYESYSIAIWSLFENKDSNSNQFEYSHYHIPIMNSILH